MQIKSITLHNFRQYKDATINFSCEEGKPFTIILGNNGFGKTTFVRSFLWCLYQDNQFDDKVLLNNDVLKEMSVGDTKTVSVKMQLVHNNTTYQITTREEYRKLLNGSADSSSKPTTYGLRFEDTGSKPMAESETRRVIEEMLSPELKDYFFFDGESNKIDNVSSKKNLTEAVSDIMGLKRVELIQKFFDIHSSESVYAKLNSQIKSNNPIEAAEIRRQIEEKEAQIDDYKKTIEGNNKQIDGLDQKIDEEEQIIDANLSVKEDQEKKKILERKLDTEKNEVLRKQQQSLIAINKNNSLLKILFTDSYHKFKLESMLSSSSFVSQNSWSHISEEVIDQIIQRGECLCGQKITNNEEALKHLQSQKQHMEPHDFGRYAKEFCDSENAALMSTQTAYEGVSVATGDFLDSLEAYDQDKTDLEALKKRVANHEDVGIHQQKVDNFKIQRSNLEGRNDQIINSSIPTLQNEIDALQKKLDVLAAKDEENKETNKLIKYAINVFNWAQAKTNQGKQQIREELEKKVSSVFGCIYTGKRTVKIDDRFYATTEVLDGTSSYSLDRSTGTETVKNFSFVCGLMDLVKERILAKNEDDSPELDAEIDTDYPLVMDAPFSNTDQTHIQNICLQLPKHCNQIIMFVMNSHFNLARDAIGDQVGQIYHIERQSETHDDIIEGEGE